MKKLMFVAAAVAASVAIADGIVSANIVGYENKAVDTSKTLNCSVATFKPVGEADGVMGDVKANATFSFGGDAVQILDPNSGATLKTMTYLTAEEGESYNCAAGWYDMNYVSNEWDWESQIPDEYTYTSDPLPFGTVFIVTSGNDGAALTYAGEVLTADTQFPIDTTVAFNFLGNVTPTDRTFADITANATFAFGGDSVQILDPDSGATLKTMTYLTEEEAPSYNCNPGWYDMNYVSNEWDWESQIPEEYTYTSEPCPSGFGFFVTSGNDGAYIEIPSALKK